MKLNFLVLSISNVLNENKNEINKDLMIEAFIKIQKKKKKKRHYSYFINYTKYSLLLIIMLSISLMLIVIAYKTFQK